MLLKNKVYLQLCIGVLLLAFMFPASVLADTSEEGYFLLDTGIPVIGQVNDMMPTAARTVNDFKKLGTIYGKIRYFDIWQSVDTYNRDGSVCHSPKNSATLGFFLEYKTPSVRGLYGAFEYVNIIKLHDGHHFAPYNDAYYVQNEKYHIFNELYLDYNFKEFGLPKTDLRIGRQIRHLDFFKRYNLRQKDQSMEAVVLTIDDVDKLNLTMGYMKKFSSWSSRDTAVFPTQFINLGNRMQVTYQTSGCEFVSALYKGIPNTAITYYDWYLTDLFNVMGAKAEYTVKYGDVKAVPRVHWAWEREVGRMKKDGRGKIYSWILELSTALQYKDLITVQPGYTWVAKNERNQINDFQQPFDTSFLVDMEKGGSYTCPMHAGSQSFVLSTKLCWKKTKLITTWYYTIHTKNVINGTLDRGTRDQQLETDLIQQLTPNVELKLTYVYGTLGTNMTFRKDLEKQDFRIAMEYRF